MGCEKQAVVVEWFGVAVVVESTEIGQNKVRLLTKNQCARVTYKPGLCRQPV